jgi:hypothetical protein
VLKTAKEAKTIAAHIKALGKVRAKTEDQVLLDKIDKAIEALQRAHASATKEKSTPMCLDKATDLLVKDLVEHCNQAVAAQKPEWQVIAERNGWGPKT